MSTGSLTNARSIVSSPATVSSSGALTSSSFTSTTRSPTPWRLAIRSPAGTVVQTGDFKIDTTPIDGGVIDMARLAAIGEEGVLCLLSDSTNAAKPGFTESERKVGETFDVQFRRAGNRPPDRGDVRLQHPPRAADHQHRRKARAQGSAFGQKP